jgi:hypothetical protein
LNIFQSPWKIEIAQQLERNKYVMINFILQYIKDIFNLFFSNNNDSTSFTNLKLTLYIVFTKHLNFILKMNNFLLKIIILNLKICLKVKNLIITNLYNEVWNSFIDKCYLYRKYDVISCDVFVTLCKAIRLILESVNIIKIKDFILLWKVLNVLTLSIFNKQIFLSNSFK